MNEDSGLKQFVVIVLFIVAVIGGSGLFLMQQLQSGINTGEAESKSGH